MLSTHTSAARQRRASTAHEHTHAPHPQHTHMHFLLMIMPGSLGFALSWQPNCLHTHTHLCSMIIDGSGCWSTSSSNTSALVEGSPLLCGCVCGCLTAAGVAATQHSSAGFVTGRGLLLIATGRCWQHWVGPCTCGLMGNSKGQKQQQPACCLRPN